MRELYVVFHADADAFACADTRKQNRTGRGFRVVLGSERLACEGYAAACFEAAQAHCITARLGHERQVARRRRDGEYRGLFLPVKRHGRLAESARLIAKALAVVLVKNEAAGCARRHKDFHILCAAQLLFARHMRLHGDNRARAHKERHGFKRSVCAQQLIAAVDIAGERIRPHAFGQPDAAGAKAARVRRGCDGRCNQFAAEPVRALRLVRVRTLGMGVVQRAHQRNKLCFRAAVHGIQVREQAVAQAHEVADDQLRALVVRPRLAPIKQAVAAVEAEDRREHAKLNPAGIQLIVASAQHVAADIMAPPAVADVGGRGGEVRLEGERRPADAGIAGEADRAALAAVAAKAGEDHAALAVTLRGKEVHVVEHPQRGNRLKALALAVLARNLVVVISLLPVHPPEIDAVRFVGKMQRLKVRFEELGVQAVKAHRRLRFRIDAHSAGHRFVLHLVAAHALSRMQVERGLKPSFVQPGDEALVVREEIPVPRIARPAVVIGAAVAVGEVPVHIHDAHAQRHVMIRKAVHKAEVALFRVLVVAAPPVAQRIRRQHLRPARQAAVIRHSAGIVMAIAKEVHVRTGPARRKPTVLRHQGRCAVVDKCIAVHRAYAVADGAGAVHVVQRGRRAAQILERLFAKAPDKRRSAGAGDVQAIAKRFARRIADGQAAGRDDGGIPLTGDHRRSLAEAAVKRYQRRFVGIVSLLDTDQTGRNHRNAHALQREHVFRLGRCIHAHSQVFGKDILHRLFLQCIS